MLRPASQPFLTVLLGLSVLLPRRRLDLKALPVRLPETSRSPSSPAEPVAQPCEPREN
jgi:hypothetical protein